jgi:GT2 family glycosyltransferase
VTTTRIPPAGAAVTLVVVPRERFSHARRSLESVYRHTRRPFSLVYVDGNSPPRVQRYLRQASLDRGFSLVRRDRFLSPNEARNLGLEHVDPASKYVVFLDNDVEVEPGWLDALVACAEETGAWAVAPVYFEGRPADRVIHMAGGTAGFTGGDGSRAFHEDHLHSLRRYPDVADRLERGETGFFEFHCVLLPLAVLRRLGPLDEGFLSNHEHLDLSLLIRQAGGAVYLAPGARVTYVHGLLDAHDLEYASLRWSDDWNRRSMRRFVEKWSIDETSAWPAAAIEWGRRHREHLMRMRRSLRVALKRFAASSLLTRRAYSTLRAAMRSSG